MVVKGFSFINRLYRNKKSRAGPTIRAPARDSGSKTYRTVLRRTLHRLRHLHWVCRDHLIQ